jgi:hypothetical protein
MSTSHTALDHAELVDSTFAKVLHADGPDPERAVKLALFAWLIGDWEFDVTTLPEDGTLHHDHGEIHAGWVLRGRAIQDVWMIPHNWYGTTLRIYDPALDAWHILWNDPATNFFSQQIARGRAGDIVQEGADPRGGSMRWTFDDISKKSFHWMAERARDGEDWRREVDIQARRV